MNNKNGNPFGTRANGSVENAPRIAVVVVVRRDRLDSPSRYANRVRPYLQTTRLSFRQPFPPKRFSNNSTCFSVRNLTFSIRWKSFSTPRPMSFSPLRPTRNVFRLTRSLISDLSHDDGTTSGEYKAGDAGVRFPAGGCVMNRAALSRRKLHQSFSHNSGAAFYFLLVHRPSSRLVDNNNVD